MLSRKKLLFVVEYFLILNLIYFSILIVQYPTFTTHNFQNPLYLLDRVEIIFSCVLCVQPFHISQFSLSSWESHYKGWLQLSDLILQKIWCWLNYTKGQWVYKILPYLARMLLLSLSSTNHQSCNVKCSCFGAKSRSWWKEYDGWQPTGRATAAYDSEIKEQEFKRYEVQPPPP